VLWPSKNESNGHLKCHTTLEDQERLGLEAIRLLEEKKKLKASRKRATDSDSDEVEPGPQESVSTTGVFANDHHRAFSAIVLLISSYASCWDTDPGVLRQLLRCPPLCFRRPVILRG
jgi:hypothetical protein